MQLRIPGPTPIPEHILQAMARQMINHRGKEFAELMGQVTARLKEFFQTQNDVLVLTSSGTGGMEAAIVNTLSPGDEVLAICNGFFGDRFAHIAQAYGAQVERLDFPWGEAADPEELRRALDKNPRVEAVLVVHNETSTGLTNPLADLSQVVREFEKLLLVDAISSLGALELAVDGWGLDVVVTGSQKGWMAPPGLAMVSLSPRAWQAQAQAKMPRYYWDLAQAKRFLEKGQTPWTPALSNLYALAASLEVMAQEGLPNILARHARVGRRAREGVKALGLALFPDERFTSNTVTSIRASPGLEVKRLLQLLEEEQGIVLAGGQQRLAEKTFRIGHLGWVTEADIDGVLNGLEAALPQAGFVKVVAEG